MVSTPIIKRKGRGENEASEGWGVRGGVGEVGARRTQHARTRGQHPARLTISEEGRGVDDSIACLDAGLHRRESKSKAEVRMVPGCVCDSAWAALQQHAR